jgi:hypothetical protein
MDLPLLERRRIEAGVLVPLIRAFQAEFGEERVNAIAARTIREIARAQGQAERERSGARSLTDVAARARSRFLAEGSLEIDVLEETPARFSFDVTRCQFQEMYEEMGARDLGYLLSCNRDFAYFEGLAPGIEFERTQTRMEGAPCCDFRFRQAAP